MASGHSYSPPRNSAALAVALAFFLASSIQPAKVQGVAHFTHFQPKAKTKKPPRKAGRP